MPEVPDLYGPTALDYDDEVQENSEQVKSVENKRIVLAPAKATPEPHASLTSDNQKLSSSDSVQSCLKNVALRSEPPLPIFVLVNRKAFWITR